MSEPKIIPVIQNPVGISGDYTSTFRAGQAVSNSINNKINQIKKIETKVGEFQAIKYPDDDKRVILNDSDYKGGIAGIVNQEQNAFRHVLLNAAITSQVGEIEANAASTQHEGGLGILRNAFNFSDTNLTQNEGESNVAFMQRVDTSVDLQNNVIGREIGKSAPKNSSVQSLTKNVANEFATNGLYMPSYKRTADGKLSATVSRQKISPEKNNAIQTRVQQLENKPTSTQNKQSAVTSKEKIVSMLKNGNTLNEIKATGFTSKDISTVMENKLKTQSLNNATNLQQTNSVRVG
jgi:hypothetical protein